MRQATFELMERIDRIGLQRFRYELYEFLVKHTDAAALVAASDNQFQNICFSAVVKLHSVKVLH